MNWFETWKAYLLEANDRDVDESRLRRVLGLVPFALPVVAVVACGRLAPTLSDYYYTNSQDWFEGCLFLIGAFLMTYRGHQRRDFWITTVLGALALGVFLFPCWTAGLPKGTPVGLLQLPVQWSDVGHLSCAGLLFLGLAIYIARYFTLSHPGQVVPRRKQWRNRLYWACAGAIVGALVTLIALAAWAASQGKTLGDLGAWGLLLETIMLWAFGLAWAVKGGLFLGDRAETEAKTAR